MAYVREQSDLMFRGVHPSRHGYLFALAISSGPSSQFLEPSDNGYLRRGGMSREVHAAGAMVPGD